MWLLYISLIVVAYIIGYFIFYIICTLLYEGRKTKKEIQWLASWSWVGLFAIAIASIVSETENKSKPRLKKRKR